MFQFKLPDIGEGVYEAELVSLSIKEGDMIEENGVIGEILTDKASVELTSPVKGTVTKINFKPGDMMKVGESVIDINEKNRNESKSFKREWAKQAKKIIHKEPVKQKKVASQLLSKASPAVRSYARQVNVNLSDVQGSGPKKRILRRDIMFYLDSESTSLKAKPLIKEPVKDQKDWIRKPLRGIQKAMANHMVESVSHIPHVTYMDELDVTIIIKKRKTLSPLVYIAKEVVSLLADFPYLNASLDDKKQEIILKKNIHLGIATHTKEGLLVPVIKDTHKYSLNDLSIKLSEITKKAREKRLPASDLKGSTFTISSLGKLGGLWATPIIHYPEVAILGLHCINKRPRYINNKLEPRDMMGISLSFDHRLIDGVYAAQFIEKLKERCG